MPIRVGLIGFGEVGSIFSKVLVENGAKISVYDVLISQRNGEDILKKRALVDGIRFCQLSKVVQESDFILSLVTTQFATKVAAECKNYLKPGQVYFDLNSTAPSVKTEIDRIIKYSGADFVEGAILGAVGATGVKTRILSGGEKGKNVADVFSHLGLNVKFYNAKIGKASLFKMLRSIFSKGLEALILELLIAGKRADIENDLWNDISDFMMQNKFDRIADNWVRSHAVAYERRYHEMMQVLETMNEIEIEPIMTTATKEFFKRSIALNLQRLSDNNPLSMLAVVEVMENALKTYKNASP